MTVLPISMGLAITTDHCGEKYLRFPGIWELSGLSTLSCKAFRFKRGGRLFSSMAERIRPSLTRVTRRILSSKLSPISLPLHSQN